MPRIYVYGSRTRLLRKHTVVSSKEFAEPPPRKRHTHVCSPQRSQGKLSTERERGESHAPTDTRWPKMPGEHTPTKKDRSNHDRPCAKRGSLTSKNTPVHHRTHSHAHVLALLATRTTCTTRASPVRSRCRRARPCGSRPAAAADPTPRRPSCRASPPRRPTPAPGSSTCVESKAARASAGWLFGGGLQRQSVPQAAPKRANPRGASTMALHHGPAPWPGSRHEPALAEAPAHVALVDILDQPLERLELRGARRVRIGRVLCRGEGERVAPCVGLRAGEQGVRRLEPRRCVACEVRRATPSLVRPRPLGTPSPTRDALAYSGHPRLLGWPPALRPRRGRARGGRSRGRAGR